MPAVKLFETADRDASHRELEKALKGGKYPHAECREDHSLEFPYQVWSEAAPWVQTAPPPEPPRDETTPSLADVLAHPQRYSAAGLLAAILSNAKTATESAK